jgi:hypothetical protein
MSSLRNLGVLCDSAVNSPAMHSPPRRRERKDRAEKRNKDPTLRAAIRCPSEAGILAARVLSCKP